MSSKWVISCEHGGNHIPDRYKGYFKDAEAALQSHRGYDPGALELYRLLADKLADFSHFSRVSRLLVELNRSLHHQKLFSSYTRGLSPELKKDIIDTYYLPYRQRLEEKIEGYIGQQQQVVHLSIHSFTPALDGELRNADIGLLYDPARPAEKAFCRAWKNRLQTVMPEAKIRFNYPYLGKADGFTTHLRRHFPQCYIGIELELNQQYAGDQVMYLAILQSLRNLQTTYMG